MAEKKRCDMSDNLQSSEIPLKKRKDSRLSNSPSASWHIENSHTGNPLKKRFFRSPCNEDKLSRTSVLNSYFSSANEQQRIFTSDLNSAVVGNNIPLEDNGIINLSSANKDLYFSHGPTKIILKPSKKVENDFDVLKSDCEGNKEYKEHKLQDLNNFDKDTEYMSYKKNRPTANSSPIIIPGVQDLSCKNSSLNSNSLTSDSKTFLDAMDFISSMYSGVSNSSKKLRTNEYSDIKRLKTEECHLIPETNKTVQKHKGKCDLSDNTQSVLGHNINGYIEKSKLKSESSSSLLFQDEVSPSPLQSNYLRYFCGSEINTSPSQSSLRKADSLFPQESHSHSFGELEQAVLSIQQSADNAVSFNKEDMYNYLSSSNLSNAEHEFTSEVKKDKYFSRPSSSLDNFCIQSNSSKSPLDFSLLLKTADEVSEVRGGNERHNIGESSSQGNADHINLRPLKSPVHFNVCKNNEYSVPQHDTTSEIPSNMGASNSHVNTDYIHSRTIKSPLFLSFLLKSNETSIPPHFESHCNVGTSSSQENLCYKPSTLDIRFFKCIDNIRNIGDNDFSTMSCSKDKKENEVCISTEHSDKQSSKNHLSLFNITKDKEEPVIEENIQSVFQQNLLSESNKKSKEKLKYFPPYSFSKREEERKDDDELENTLIDVCKEQLRNYVQVASQAENIPKQKTSEESLFHKDEDKSEYNIFTKSKNEDKLKSALIEVCEEELKNSFVESSSTYAKRCVPMNESQGKVSPGSSYKLEDCVIDLCSNNDKRANDEGDDDVEVIEVLNNQNSNILIENCKRPVSSTTQLDSFESVFQCRPSTSKCRSKFDSPTLPLDMTNPQVVHMKSVLELPPSSTLTASGSQQAHQNKRKEKKYFWDPILLNSNDDYLSISSPDSVISISSSSPSSSPERQPNQSNERSIEEEIFDSLIREMDLNQCKRPSVLKRAKRSKEIPVLTLPEDESSNEDKDLRRKKSEVSEKGRKGKSDSHDTVNDSKLRSELECAICLESMNSNRGTSATTCGHVYCTPCIEEVIEKKGECPTCRKALDSTQVHKLFLFA